ncbi:HlyD family type I secretion periplasmic adaptor subunit (plasmid) [Rhizobium ruizarguesonis]|jgi:HlyD family secretion protein|uniref:Membrane fusion protein (MFP) family protein n=1 Tax=Rhizobium ruizarguesonis TaxID=2081791 RepID=A0AAE5C082_9HYPH|nr:HlyD family type I secretion periplasmic adaptor subunit [Rhizobium ruizarguesonis]MBY5884751.1 HlyD family type I secretion periplasmic adaptor subunit [Rhizobium leguminosarum]TBY58645.1 HlyD family type I secretion periplasmic adaptor subunit [Rhizobium leguminosarum bv. viciae]MBY5893353.1 HlyD family type I secretion periplasmic adaptor subunit [Rhizobium leguminosarum]NEI27153.1 HlyD family type I secretion periplasmic adaptor subunit [Rhizobium ruizarguesonis]NEI46437.1 HlyD family t
MNAHTRKPSENLPVPSGKGPSDKAPSGKGRELTARPPLPPAIAEFQSDAVELEERAPPRVARMTLYCVTALIASAIIWASVSSIDEVVIAPGKLVTTQPTIVVQPLETSIIRTIEVKAGEVVHAGQTLATLDATFSQADVDQQQAKFSALDAQVRRIEAELAGNDYTAGDTPDQMLQAQLFGQRRAFYTAQLQNFEQQIAGQSAALLASKNQEAVLNDRRDGLSQIEAARERLYNKQSGSLITLLGSRDARLDVESDLTAVRGRADEAAHAYAKLSADRQAFIEDFRRAAMEQLVELRGQRDMADEELKKMALRRNMVVLTAPADSVVLDLAQRSVGSVVREAEPVVTLVPINVPLEAEVSINTRDIGRVAVGKEARVKLDAYPFQKYGTATGEVRTISQDTFLTGQQEQTATPSQPAAPFFKARILLADTRLNATDVPVRLLPGMTVTTEIKVGNRTVISYFLYPLLRGLDNAIREP